MYSWVARPFMWTSGRRSLHSTLWSRRMRRQWYVSSSAHLSIHLSISYVRFTECLQYSWRNDVELSKPNYYWKINHNEPGWYMRAHHYIWNQTRLIPTMHVFISFLNPYRRLPFWQRLQIYCFTISMTKWCWTPKTQLLLKNAYIYILLCIFKQVTASATKVTLQVQLVSATRTCRQMAACVTRQIPRATMVPHVWHVLICSPASTSRIVCARKGGRAMTVTQV